jgi:hypothetical protein
MANTAILTERLVTVLTFEMEELTEEAITRWPSRRTSRTSRCAPPAMARITRIRRTTWLCENEGSIRPLLPALHQRLGIGSGAEDSIFNSTPFLIVNHISKSEFHPIFFGSDTYWLR